MRPSRALHAVTVLLAAPLLAGTFLPRAVAEVRYAYAYMNGGMEVPPVMTPATGEALWTIDLSSLPLKAHFEITYQNLTSAEVQAHVHGPATTSQNGPIMEHLPVGTLKIGTWLPTGTDMGHLLNGFTYTNIHSVNFPGGEIRGNQFVIGKGFCFGDGSGTACPCGNTGGPYEGCRNTTGAGGRLRPAGFPVANGSLLRFISDQLVPNVPALLFVGSTALNGGNGLAFGDGLRCAGGTVIRLGVKSSNAAGRAEWGPGLDTQGGWAPGDVRRFQVWFRDPAGGGACGSSFNLTNGVEIPIF